MVAAATPVDLVPSLSQLEEDWERGCRSNPTFQYPDQPLVESLIGPLRNAAKELQHQGQLGEIYARRAQELALEAEICLAVGTDRFAPLAARRYRRRDRFDDKADALCTRWLEAAQPATPHPEELVRSDDEGHPESLVNRMRQAVGAARIPFRVQLTDRLVALSATGAEVIYVAQGRLLGLAAVRRTVLHEIQGHALPRHRASHASLGIFAAATAHGADDQEGYALRLEQNADLLDQRRQRELALRHLAATTVRQGASFVETVTTLTDYEGPLADRLRIAARVHRGGGLARELVYLPALLRIIDAFQRDRSLEGILAAGRVAVNEAPALRPWLDLTLS